MVFILRSGVLLSIREDIAGVDFEKREKRVRENI